MQSNLEVSVYSNDLPTGLDRARLPGVKIEDILAKRKTEKDNGILTAKLEDACRKICMMCRAGERSLRAEQDFYMSTCRESPALFGEEAVEICYHSEAFVCFARSSLDVAANIFGQLLLDKNLDSFNDLTKMIAGTKKAGPGRARLGTAFLSWVVAERDEPGAGCRSFAATNADARCGTRSRIKLGYPLTTRNSLIIPKRNTRSCTSRRTSPSRWLTS
jgi:hypothetical protein